MGVIVGLVLGVIGATDGFPLDMMGAAAASLAAGVALVRHPRHRDRRPLPVPAYGTLSNPRPPETQEQLAAAGAGPATGRPGAPGAARARGGAGGRPGPRPRPAPRPRAPPPRAGIPEGPPRAPGAAAGASRAR